MVRFERSFLPATLLFVASAYAANDWSQPCLSGHCSYDVINGTASGTLVISGSMTAISDITNAAGWTILDCDKAKKAQDIRLVCTGNNATCSHMYLGGVNGTLIRMPEHCGPMPFARIAREWIHDNQSIPDDVKAQMRRRDDGSDATVRGLSVDTNFAAVDPNQNGQVSLFIQGSTAQNGNFTVTAPTRRSLFSSLVGDALKALSFNITKSNNQALDVDKPVTLFDQSVSCPASGNIPALTGEVKVAVEAKAHATVDYGVVAVGTVIPPKVSDFGIFANFDANLNGILTVNASATATFDSGKIQIFEAGIPGLDFPGILTIGPSFVVNAQGLATLDTEVNMGVDLAYTITGAKLFFPPDKGSSLGTFAPGDNALSLSATPSVAASGSIEAHIIPTVLFGINALDGAAKANINLDLDSSAKLALSLKGGAAASTSTNAGSAASGSFAGCVDITTSLGVNAGADGSFLGLFDKSTSVSLFQKTFDVFNKCFGSSKRGMIKARKHARDVLAQRALTCPGGGSALSSIAQQTVSASSIKAL